jgi:hypothetical protein
MHLYYLSFLKKHSSKSLSSRCVLFESFSAMMDGFLRIFCGKLIAPAKEKVPQVPGDSW